ncbi:MAG: hypothetical protein K0Q74_1062 [Gammaproteobacteria bacterium]|jgi:type IV secretion system protein VirB8|nr:hypothetical protein [Gammaproteobacteria bacterium]
MKGKLEKDGTDWYADRYEAIRVERNRYFVLMLICLVGLILSTIANLLLSPLKTAVPYLIEVNKESGFTTVLKPVDLTAIKQNEAITVYFLYKYMNARMSYDYALRQLNADIVRALSSAQTYQQYANQMDTSNPESPIRRYQDRSRVEMKIMSYSFPYPDIAQIRFYTEVQPLVGLLPANAKPVRQYWQATIKFAYSNSPLPLTERINFNPLGFFITSFQLNQEIPKEI